MGERTKDCDVNNDVVSSRKENFLFFKEEEEHFPLGKLFCMANRRGQKKQTNTLDLPNNFLPVLFHLLGIEKICGRIEFCLFLFFFCVCKYCQENFYPNGYLLLYPNNNNINPNRIGQNITNKKKKRWELLV